MSELGRVSTLEAGSVAFAAHTLNNYLNVATATLELVDITLEGHHDPQLHVWLDSLKHATSLIAHPVSQLMNASVGQDPRCAGNRCGRRRWPSGPRSSISGSRRTRRSR